jgi:hypothetical protein
LNKIVLSIVTFVVQNKVKPFRFFFFLFSFFLIRTGFSGLCQSFDPPAGHAESKALSHLSSSFQSWASEVVQIQRGYRFIQMPDSGFADAGIPENALGPALTAGVVSLGDGGSITLHFNPPIRDGEGPDFAVFENGFSETFLELGFVEVSSDGVHFVRFPALSESPVDQQIPGFGSVNARHLHNLAGKYHLGFGTPFDLRELQAEAGLDRERVSHVRVVDVVGSINPEIGSFDSRGNLINDPFPTPFPTSGFDLDAIGVLHQAQTGTGIRPNRLRPGDPFQIAGVSDPKEVCLFSALGTAAGCFTSNASGHVVPAGLRKGLYFVRVSGIQETFPLMVW